MLHDPEMEVSCDNEDCADSVYLPMRWNTHGYDLSDSAAEKMLVNTHDWIVRDGKHYCCESCKVEEEVRLTREIHGLPG